MLLIEAVCQEHLGDERTRRLKQCLDWIVSHATVRKSAQMALPILFLSVRIEGLGNTNVMLLLKGTYPRHKK